jgi:hypothetical protein
MRPGSLRWRLLIGSLLWTAGLVVIVNWLSLAVILRHAGSRPILHVSAMVLLAVGCMVVGLMEIRRGVSPCGGCAHGSRSCETVRRAVSTASIRRKSSRSSTTSMRCSSIASTPSRARWPKPAISRTA